MPLLEAFQGKKYSKENVRHIPVVHKAIAREWKKHADKRSALEEVRGQRGERRNARRGSKDAIVWQGPLVKPENKLWMSKDNEVHATRYSDAPRARIARSYTTCGFGARACIRVYTRVRFRRVYTYIREDITWSAHIFTRSISFSRGIISEIKLRHAALLNSNLVIRSAVRYRSVCEYSCHRRYRLEIEQTKRL